jgi:hypothetical protein
MIGIPVGDWPGKCFAVAAAFLREGVASGELRYGTYWGPVDEESMFAGAPLISHGWICQNISDGSGKILDPTRWAITQPCDPAIMVGPGAGEYDAGSQGVLKEIRAAQRAPSWAEGRAEHDLSDLSEAAKRRAKEILRCRREKITTEQLNWLAGAPLDALGERAEEIYRWTSDLGHRVFIPVDHQAIILGQGAAPSAYDYARAE